MRLPLALARFEDASTNFPVRLKRLRSADGLFWVNGIEAFADGLCPGPKEKFRSTAQKGGVFVTRKMGFWIANPFTAKIQIIIRDAGFL